MTSSTRRDHWLTLIKEITLLHRFLLKFNIESPMQALEMHARTILGILRLHAVRGMLRISPLVPTNFLIFSLYDDLPKGDYVLEELSNSLKQINRIKCCNAASILKSLSMSFPKDLMEMKEGFEEHPSNQADTLASLETIIGQVMEEAKEVSSAKATIEEMKEEGISDSLLVLMELLSPLKNVLPWIEGILSWETPTTTFFVLAMSLVIIYKEWIGYTLAVFLMCGVGMMLWARRKRMGEKCNEVVVPASLIKTTMESIVAAQHSLKSLHELVKTVNITILKIWSIMVSKAPKHANMVMWVMTGGAVLLVVVPFKFMLMGLTLYLFMANSMVGKSMSSEDGDRRLREWWESIPIILVRIVNNPP